MSDPPVGVAETHSGVVFFVGGRAYKLKKPVNLGFLDYRTREARETACHREVALNRRLAPDVYLGVGDVHGPDGAVCDHLIVMNRMPADRRLSTLVIDGAPVDDHLWHLAHLLAAFHARAERSVAADRAAGAGALGTRWADNTAGLSVFAGRLLDGPTIDRVQRLARRYLAGREALFERRIAEGRSCDGHGDILADDIFCLDDGPRVLDCIEFDDELRYGDALADVAFLAMDLERLGRADLAEAFLAAYREHAADTWPSSLAHHHIAYRAQIRAKVTAIRADQGHTPSVAEAPRLLELALRHLEAGRIRLILVGGLPGTGKSTLAAAIGEALDAAVLRSDEMRKEITGIPADHPAPAAFGTGIYSPRTTAATYQMMLERAGTATAFGETVVLDASWSDDTWREEARSLAADCDADLVELRCEAPPEVTEARIAQRAATGGDPSDATPAIARTMARTSTAWASAATIDTNTAPERSVAEAMRVIQSDSTSPSDGEGSSSR